MGTANPLYARLGLEVRPAGSAPSLAVAIGGMELAAANRIGFYVDTTVSDEILGVVSGGTEVARFHNDLVDATLEVLGSMSATTHVHMGDMDGGHTPINGDIWYDGVANQFVFRQNGLDVNLGGATPVAPGTLVGDMLYWDGAEWFGTSLLNWTEGTGYLEVSGGITVSDGVVGTPSLAFTSDPDTGLYLTGPGSIGVAVGGVNLVTIDSTGVATSADIVGEFITANQDLDVSGMINATGGGVFIAPQAANPAPAPQQDDTLWISTADDLLRRGSNIVAISAGSSESTAVGGVWTSSYSLDTTDEATYLFILSEQPIDTGVVFIIYRTGATWRTQQVSTQGIGTLTATINGSNQIEVSMVANDDFRGTAIRLN